MGIMLSPEKLRRFPLFAGIDFALLKKIAMASEEIKIRQGDWLFHEGDVASSLYLVISGAIELRITVSEETVYPPGLSTIVDGDVLGWSALIEPYTYKLGAIALKDSRLAKIDGVRLCELMAHYPALGYKLMSRITQIVGCRLKDMRVRFVSLVEGERWQTVGGRRVPKHVRDN